MSVSVTTEKPRACRRHHRLTRAIHRPEGWVDGRTKEGRYLRTYQAMLEEHIGGMPSPVQRELIRRACRLALHLELADELALAGTPRDAQVQRNYVAMSCGLTRILRLLGAEPPENRSPEPPSLRDYLAPDDADGPD